MKVNTALTNELCLILFWNKRDSLRGLELEHGLELELRLTLPWLYAINEDVQMKMLDAAMFPQFVTTFKNNVVR